jgi:predicted Zn-dependent protease
MRQMQACSAINRGPITFADEQRVGAKLVFERAQRLTPAAPPLSAEALAAADRSLNLIGKGLAAGSSRWGIPWVFGVLDSPDVALISGGGGSIFVSRGALSLADDEAQVAALLAIGVARVDLRQAAAHQLARRQMICLGGAGQQIGIDLKPDEARAEVKIDGKKVELDGYDQWEDHEAAQHAAALLTFTGYDVVDGAKVFERIPASTDSSLQPVRLAASLLAADRFDGVAPPLSPELAAVRLTASARPGTAAPTR